MKKLPVLILAFLTAHFAHAQAPSVAASMTRIDSVYKRSFQFGRIKVTSVSLQGTQMVRIFSDADTTYLDLAKVGKLALETHHDGSKWHLVSADGSGKPRSPYLLGHIGNREHALLLKQELEFVIAALRSKTD